MIIDNNINSNNNRNEILFFKIIRNKYLFTLVLYYIRNQNIRYRDINKVYCGNRKPWSSIVSLQWLVVTKQYSLLLDKLKSDKYLHIDTMSINLFLERCFNKTIIEKLLEKKFLQLSISDLIKTSIKNRNSIALEIFLEKRFKNNRYINNNNTNSNNSNSNKYFLPIYPSTIISAIQFSNVDILEMILNHLEIDEIESLITPIKSQLINISLANRFYKEDMISFILNNKIISPFINSIINNSNNSNNGDNSNSQLITFIDLISFSSNKLKNQLLDLNLVEPPKYDYIPNETKLINSSIEDLELILRIKYQLIDNCGGNISGGIRNDNNEDINNKKKELLKEIVRNYNSDEIYLNYLFQYNEAIKEKGDTVLLSYTFNFFDCNSLRNLISKYCNSGVGNESDVKCQDIRQIEFSNSIFNQFLNSSKFTNEQRENQIKQFIKLYFNNDDSGNISSNINSVLVFNEWNKVIEVLLTKYEISVSTLEYIKSFIPVTEFFNVKRNIRVVPFSKYKWFIELATSSNLPKDVYSQFNKIPPLTQPETIDFVVENHEFYQLYQNNSVDLSDSFKTLENVTYFINKLESVNPSLKDKLIKSSIYSKPFFRALSTADIPSLIYLESIITTSPPELDNKSNDNSKLYIVYENGNICSKDNLNLLLEYLNERGFRLLFSETLYYHYMEDLFYQFEELDLKEYKINLNQFPRQSIKLLYYYILKLKLPIIKYILLQLDFDLLFQQEKDNNGIEEQIKNLVQYISSVSISGTIMNSVLFSFKNLFSIIYYLIVKIPLKYREFFISTFNYLYKLIVMVPDITLDEIKELLLLFKDRGIEIKSASLFHLIYYLNSKDPILSNYLFKASQIYYYKSDLSRFLSSTIISDIEDQNSSSVNEFTLDYISNSSVKDILLKLKRKIMDKYILSEESAYYFLTVNQFDLFLECITNSLSPSLSSVNNNNNENNHHSTETIPPYNKIEICLVNYLDTDSLKKLLDSNSVYTKSTQNRKQLLLSFIKYSRFDLVQYLLDHDISRGNNYNNPESIASSSTQLNEDRELYLSAISRQLIIELIRDYKFDAIKYLSGYSSQLFKGIGEVEFVLCFAVGHIEMFEFLAQNYLGPNYKIDKKSIKTAISNYKPFIILYFLDRIPNKEFVIKLFKDHQDFRYLNLIN